MKRLSARRRMSGCRARHGRRCASGRRRRRRHRAVPAAPDAPPTRPRRRGRIARRRRSAIGVDIVSLNVTVDGRSEPLRHRPRAERTSPSSRTASSRTSSFFNRRQQPIALSLLLDSSASMEDKLDDAADGGRELRPPAEAERHRAGDRLRQPRRNPAGVHRRTSAELEAAICKTAAGGSTSLHNAIYIALKELREGQGAGPKRTCGGRRSSSSPTARTRRA